MSEFKVKFTVPDPDLDDNAFSSLHEALNWGIEQNKQFTVFAEDGKTIAVWNATTGTQQFLQD